MKDLSKTELLIMKCVWGSDRPVTATQIQQILLEMVELQIQKQRVLRIQMEGSLHIRPWFP